jgi:PPP family 3-phenylpropionic acid transporter
MSNQINSENPAKLILGLQYFLYFGVLGIYLPYFNLYCFHLDFSGSEIGAMSAVRTVSTVLFPLFWGAVADRFRIRKPIYICCNFISCFIWAFFLFTVDFGIMLGISIFYGIFYAPVISFLEAFTMDALGKKKKQYGRIRVWGSINFIVIVVLIGRLIDLQSVNIIIPCILIGSLLQALFSIKIPDESIVKKGLFGPGARVLLEPRLIIFLTAAFLMLLSHGTYYGFFSIHLEKLGYGKTFIGITWALASIAEILVMINSDSIFQKISIQKVLIISFFIASARWLILGFTESAAIILLSQIMHAATYGTFHIASILYIDQLIPSEAKTFGQAVNNAVSYGLGMTAGFILNGLFFDRLDSSPLFAVSALVALAGGILMSIPVKPTKTPRVVK